MCRPIAELLSLLYLLVDGGGRSSAPVMDAPVALKSQMLPRTIVRKPEYERIPSQSIAFPITLQPLAFSLCYASGLQPFSKTAHPAIRRDGHPLKTHPLNPAHSTAIFIVMVFFTLSIVTPVITIVAVPSA